MFVISLDWGRFWHTCIIGCLDVHRSARCEVACRLFLLLYLPYAHPSASLPLCPSLSLPLSHFFTCSFTIFSLITALAILGSCPTLPTSLVLHTLRGLKSFQSPLQT